MDEDLKISSKKNCEMLELIYFHYNFLKNNIIL